MFLEIRPASHHKAGDQDGPKYEGQTPGCGCCSDHEPITPENLRAHIAELEGMLEQAKAIQAEIG